MTGQTITYHPAGFNMNTTAMTPTGAALQASPANAAPVTHLTDGHGGAAAAPLPGDELHAYAQSNRGISLDRAADMLTSGVSTAARVWEFETGGTVSSSPCVSPDGTVYVGSNDQKVYALKDGKKLWEFETGGHVFSSPCVGPDGTVYVGSCDANLYALKDGKKLWEFKTGDEIRSSPCLGPDGTVYVGSDDKKVYALRNPLDNFTAIENEKDTAEASGAATDEVIVEEEWIIIGDTKLNVRKT